MTGVLAGMSLTVSIQNTSDDYPKTKLNKKLQKPERGLVWI